MIGSGVCSRRSPLSKSAGPNHPRTPSTHAVTHINGRPSRVFPTTCAAATEEAVVARAPEQAVDLLSIPLPTSDESEELLRIRHSCAHIMAMAMQRVVKGTRVTIGPWIENGFYYDFDMSAVQGSFQEKDLGKVQKEMRRIIRKDLPFVREEVSPAEARERIEAIGEPYKLEILDGILARDPEAPITIYHIGNKGDKEHWWDLCAGPHVESTGKINAEAIQLERLAGAYWRGDEAKAMLTRVYGTAWENPTQLAAYHRLQEEAAKRDHRKLGKELQLFSIQESAGGGLVFWQPNGAAVRNVIESFWKDIHMQRGYQLLYTPHIAKVDLWKTSGHFEHYAENMYDQMTVEEEEYQLRPMNCPFHVLTYKEGRYSYRDLPIRWAELGTVYRYERSGTMHGLFRVRGFTQDDAHIFCLPEQIESEIVELLGLVEDLLGRFGFSDFEINLSTRPEKSIGSDEVWERAESALIQALQSKGWDYLVDAGGGAFYGPKIDIKIRDAIGRKWQCSTIQLDFNLPERFQMEYIDRENTKQRPIMIHRAILGSIERFFGVLTESYAGAFPCWLAPVQCRLLPVNQASEDFCADVVRRMKNAGIRAQMTSGEKIGKAIRNAEMDKVPVICVVGARDIEGGVLSVRTYSAGEIGQIPVDEVIERLKRCNQERIDFQT